MASAIVDSVDAGADVINLSGHCFDHNDPLHEAVQHAWEAGVLVVVAAGNAQQSDPSECVRHPAIHAQALAVAATDVTFQAADYSCRGPQIELAAPGSLVLSTLPGGYGVYSGTSMAAPHVTATGAMLLDQNPSMTPADVRDRLNETARDLGEDGHDETYGHGMVDPVAALSGRPAYVSTSTEALDSETSDPFDLACAHLSGDAECTHVAVGGTGDATTAGFGLASASATGDATACESRVGNGAVAVHPTCLALTATGDARADRVAASGASG
jgi:subtilisin family serine protease